MSSTNQLPETGFVRLKRRLAPIGPIPVSKSTWWAGVKEVALLDGVHKQTVRKWLRQGLAALTKTSRYITPPGIVTWQRRRKRMKKHNENNACEA